jgi:hypothetical protein
LTAGASWSTATMPAGWGIFVPPWDGIGNPQPVFVHVDVDGRRASTEIARELAIVRS